MKNTPCQLIYQYIIKVLQNMCALVFSSKEKIIIFKWDVAIFLGKPPNTRTGSKNIHVSERKGFNALFHFISFSHGHASLVCVVNTHECIVYWQWRFSNFDILTRLYKQMANCLSRSPLVTILLVPSIFRA